MTKKDTGLNPTPTKDSKEGVRLPVCSPDEAILPTPTPGMDRLRELAAKTHTLLSIQLNVTQRCNLSCRHCYRLPEQVSPCPDPTTRQLVDIMEQAHDLGALFVAFSGGEPLLRPDWIELFQEANRLKMATTLMTNGTLLDEKSIQKLVDLNPGQVQLSIYGATPKTHDGVTRVEGSFQTTSRAVEVLSRAGFNVFTSSVAMQQNAEEMPALFDWARQESVYLSVNLRIIPSLEGGYQKNVLYLESYQMERLLTIPELQYLVQVPEENSFRQWDELPYCAAGASSMCVNADLTVWPCTSLPVELGRLDKEQTLEDIWKDSPFLREFQALRRGKDLQECRTCEYRLSCSRCPGAAMLAGYSTHGKEPEYCKVAKVVHELKKEHKQQRGFGEKTKEASLFAAAGDDGKTH